jgi:hypothetical protein
MELQMYYLENLLGDPDPKKMFGQIHDTAFEMTALATNADAKLLGFLLMMVAEEAERLSWAGRMGNGGANEDGEHSRLDA